VAALTIKQETFCQKYVETGNASEAYRQAYGSKGKPETVARSAHELIVNPKVSARIAALREATINRVHGVTVASLISELEEARQVGKERGQASAMAAATMGKAKLAGLESGVDDADDATPIAVTVEIKSGRKRADAE